MKKMRLLPIFLCLAISLFPIEKPDSLKQALSVAKGKKAVDIMIQLSKYYGKTNPDESKMYAERALSASQKTNYKIGLARSYYRLGNLAFWENDLETAASHITNALSLFLQTDLTKETAKCYEWLYTCAIKEEDFLIANEYMYKAINLYEQINSLKDVARILTNSSLNLSRLGNMNEALLNLYKALEIKEKLADPESKKDQLSIASTLENMGLTLLNTKDYNRALDYLLKAKAKYEEWDYTDEKLLNNIGTVYNQMQDFENSSKYLYKCLEICREEGNYKLMSKVYNNIGCMYDFQKDWEKCLKYYLESMQLKRTLNDTYGLANATKNVGSIYLEIDDLPKAKQYLDESMELAKKNLFVEVVRDNHYLFSRYYEKEKNFAKALKHERVYSAMQDSIFTESMKAKIAELESGYSFREQQRKNNMLQKDKEILMLKSEKEKLARLRSNLIVLLTLLVLIYLLDLSKRKSRRQKGLAKAKLELENEVRKRTQDLERINIDLQQEIAVRKKTEELLKSSLNEKEVMLKEIHHRVKNNLQIISSIISIELEEKKTDSSTKNLLLNIQNRVYSMSLIHEKLYMESDLARVDFQNYVKDLVSFLLANYQDKSTKASVRIEAENVKLNVTTGIPCGLLINEVVTNSIKYARRNDEKYEIFILIRKTEDGLIEMVLGNDGDKFDFEKVKQENTIGLRLIELIAKQLKSKLIIDNSTGIKYILKFKEI